ncbi:sensor histidine kinase [Gorillibacterium sp. sgz5001074]|uniref:sensor histidine kinase n=1 Tax=Gorillibacterium sp. sgz5001074 TaxID=3446695 RepID=UPI003F674931
MNVKMNTFTKILILIMCLLAPLMALYYVSNRISIDTVHKEVQTLKTKDLHFYADQVDHNVGLLSTLGLLLSEDINIRQLQNLDMFYNKYEANEAVLRLYERLRLLNVSTGWETHISVYSPETQSVISTSSISYDEKYLKEQVSVRWKLGRVKGLDEDRFVKHIVQPAQAATDVTKAGIVVEISFSAQELVRSLDQFKLGGKGDPFFFKPGSDPIRNHSAENGRIAELLRLVPDGDWDTATNRSIKLGDETYLLNAVKIPSLGWYLVDYEPIEEILKPIVKSRNLFYFAMATLLVLGLCAAFVLYQQVQVPIRALVKNVQIIKKGDYSARIRMKPNNEFAFLFQRFNEMAAEIENLIQTVYAEQLRSREANLKQLQSQINPHFLYNCFALIRSMTRLGEKQSVMDLAMHLSKYYRYTTRVEKPTSSIREELQLIISYLEIQKLHLQRMDYRIQVPETMMDLEIPRLLLQPLVENAVLHGIEPMLEYGELDILGEETAAGYRLTVRDNGVGLTPDSERSLRNALHMLPTDETGCALWNIRQRMKLFWGDTAEIEFSPNHPKGLEVTVRWVKTAEKPLLDAG